MMPSQNYILQYIEIANIF